MESEGIQRIREKYGDEVANLEEERRKTIETKKLEDLQNKILEEISSYPIPPPVDIVPLQLEILQSLPAPPQEIRSGILTNWIKEPEAFFDVITAFIAR
jgi:hypothetical protein